MIYVEFPKEDRGAHLTNVVDVVFVLDNYTLCMLRYDIAIQSEYLYSVRLLKDGKRVNVSIAFGAKERMSTPNEIKRNIPMHERNAFKEVFDKMDECFKQYELDN